jgi:hypothetical protein
MMKTGYQEVEERKHGGDSARSAYNHDLLGARSPGHVMALVDGRSSAEG